MFLDSVLRDVRYACRSFRRAPLVALTIVTTVGLGLGLHFTEIVTRKRTFPSCRHPEPANQV
jgi:hypothetical protein